MSTPTSPSLVVSCLPPTGLTLHLDSKNIHNPGCLYSGPGAVGNVLVHESAKIGAGCKIGPDVSIGEGCVIGDGVRLSHCVVMRGCKIGDHAKVGVGGGVLGEWGMGWKQELTVRGRCPQACLTLLHVNGRHQHQTM
jgi:UDP-3-O-[3-hydroxymyristoyl] glucosamine N-acyltransferase